MAGMCSDGVVVIAMATVLSGTMTERDIQNLTDREPDPIADIVPTALLNTMPEGTEIYHLKARDGLKQLEEISHQTTEGMEMFIDLEDEGKSVNSCQLMSLVQEIANMITRQISQRQNDVMIALHLLKMK